MITQISISKLYFKWWFDNDLQSLIWKGKPIFDLKTVILSLFWHKIGSIGHMLNSNSIHSARKITRGPYIQIYKEHTHVCTFMYICAEIISIKEKMKHENKPCKLKGPVEILTNFLQNASANFGKSHNTKFCLCKASWNRKKRNW